MCVTKNAWERCEEFHGHTCPGLAIGYRACEAAAQRLNLSFSKDEEIVCVTENDACGVDAIQLLTGCTFGKGNLLFRDRGKQAFSFFKRATGEKVRIVFKRPFEKNMDRAVLQELILKAPLEDLFEFKSPAFDLPENARIFTSVICETCGEGAAEHKIRLNDGKKVCLDCHRDYSRGW